MLSAVSSGRPAARANTAGDWKHSWISRSAPLAASTTWRQGRVSPEKTTLRPAYADGVAHGTVQPMDGREAADDDPVAVVDRVRAVVRDLVGDRLEAGRRAHAAHRRGVPGHHLAHVMDERREPQRRVLVAAAPDLHRIDPPHLREAPQQPRDVADVIGVQMRQEDLGRGFHREPERVEVRERAGAQVEEEEVLLGVADLDEERPGRLAPPDPGVAAAQDRDPELAGVQGFRTMAPGPGRRCGPACRPPGSSTAARRPSLSSRTSLPDALPQPIGKASSTGMAIQARSGAAGASHREGDAKSTGEGPE